MSFPIAGLYALPLIPIFPGRFVRVSGRQSERKASIGPAHDAALHDRIRHPFGL